MGHRVVVVGMGDDSFDLDLLAVVCMRVAPGHAQLDRPIVEVSQCMAAEVKI